jgi:hypothetical protein
MPNYSVGSNAVDEIWDTKRLSNEKSQRLLFSTKFFETDTVFTVQEILFQHSEDSKSGLKSVMDSLQPMYASVLGATAF